MWLESVDPFGVQVKDCLLISHSNNPMNSSAVGNVGTQRKINNGKSWEIAFRQQIAYVVASERIAA